MGEIHLTPLGCLISKHIPCPIPSKSGEWSYLTTQWFKRSSDGERGVAPNWMQGTTKKRTSHQDLTISGRIING